MNVFLGLGLPWTAAAVSLGERNTTWKGPVFGAGEDLPKPPKTNSKQQVCP